MSTEPAVRVFGAKAIVSRLKAIRQHIEPVRSDDDIEAVHQMRVATRRLRVALATFRPAVPPKRFKSWRSAIRTATRALGEARDLDVRIAFLSQFAGELTDRRSRAGIERLLLRLRQTRQACQPHVVEVMDGLEYSRVLEDIDRTMKRVLDRAVREGGDEPADAVRQYARHELHRRISDLLDFESVVVFPADARQLHQMRIAAKRLRYAMEVFAEAWDGLLALAIEQVKRIQNELGDLHDCDVWIETCAAFPDQEKQRFMDFQGSLRGFSHLTPGLDHLAADRRARRDAIHRQFIETWQSLAAAETWSTLRATVDAHVQAAGDT